MSDVIAGKAAELEESGAWKKGLFEDIKALAK